MIMIINVIITRPASHLLRGLVILALGVLMPLCAYIPKASLAAVIITAVIFSVEYEVVRPMWRSKSKYNVSKIHSVEMSGFFCYSDFTS